jgi:hypothetical protein
MKKLSILLSALFYVTALSAQIPNASFENWTNATLDGWTGSATPSAVDTTVFQSTKAHSGNYAVRIRAI